MGVCEGMQGEERLGGSSRWFVFPTTGGAGKRQQERRRRRRGGGAAANGGRWFIQHE